MTNAEKLAKDTGFMLRVLMVTGMHCDYCTCEDVDQCDGKCEKRIEEWLESEVKEDAEIH